MGAGGVSGQQLNQGVSMVPTLPTYANQMCACASCSGGQPSSQGPNDYAAGLGMLQGFLPQRSGQWFTYHIKSKNSLNVNSSACSNQFKFLFYLLCENHIAIFFFFYKTELFS
jgi:hypothetical protein